MANEGFNFANVANDGELENKAFKVVVLVCATLAFVGWAFNYLPFEDTIVVYLGLLLAVEI